MLAALALSEYFDGLVSELDLKIEIVIRDNIHDQELVGRVNLVRDEFIVAIRECEALNTAHRSKQDKSVAAAAVKVEPPQQFVSYCFFIETSEPGERHEVAPLSSWSNLLDFLGTRLVVVDSYLSREQIKCFQEILKFTPCNYYNAKKRDGELLFELNAEVCVFFFD